MSAVAAGVANFIDPDDPRGRALVNAPIGLRVFTLAIDDLKDLVTLAWEAQEEQGKNVLKPAGWRVLSSTPSGQVVAADVVKPAAAPSRISSVSFDPRLRKVMQQIKDLETLAAVKQQDYELMIVKVPGILLEAFWLKSRTGAGDLLVPVLTRSEELKVMEAYPVDRFLDIARQVVTRFLDLRKDLGPDITKPKAQLP
jgi:hypothetical protein